jgi:uncharacterized protein
MANRLTVWFQANLPTREKIASNRWLKPVAHLLMRPDLWHLNRRSVPRAVAVGLFIAPIMPVAHTPIAALLAVPARANIVITAAVTWLINPFTMPIFYYEAYQIGKFLLRIDELTAVPVTQQAQSWLAWLLAKSGPTALGTLVLAVVIAAIGYLVASLLWRIRIGRKWRARHRKTL